jgi:hypothetical protein
MSYHTGNTAVVKALQKALEDFLADQRKSAMEKELSGCGCEDCTIAGQLLGSIY